MAENTDAFLFLQMIFHLLVFLSKRNSEIAKLMVRMIVKPVEKIPTAVEKIFLKSYMRFKEEMRCVSKHE